jgi:hypothetical protein
MRAELRHFAIGCLIAAAPLTLCGGPAMAACSDWLRQVALPKYGCSPQAIEDICAGRRPVPTNGTCETPAQPSIDTSGPPYQQFRSLAGASGINLQLHPSYTPQYFENRARLYCGQFAAGDIVKLTTEITFPPATNFTETTADRSRLEVAIMRVGTAAYCPQFTNLEHQWEATNIR